MDRHRTEYQRKVRNMNRRKETLRKKNEPSHRKSERSTIANAETRRLEEIIQKKNEEIDQLCLMLDESSSQQHTTSSDHSDQSVQTVESTIKPFSNQACQTEDECDFVNQFFA